MLIWCILLNVFWATTLNNTKYNTHFRISIKMTNKYLIILLKVLELEEILTIIYFSVSQIIFLFSVGVCTSTSRPRWFVARSLRHIGCFTPSIPLFYLLCILVEAYSYNRFFVLSHLLFLVGVLEPYSSFPLLSLLLSSYKA